MRFFGILQKSIISTMFSSVFFACAAQGASALVINEIMYDPAGTDTGKEWIEIYNPDSTVINLNGWQVNAASGDYYTFSDVSLLGSAFLIIQWGADGTDSASELFTGNAGFDNMGNTSGFVALFNTSSHTKDTIIDYVEYGAGEQTWESVASSAGIWVRGTFAPDVVEGSSLGLATDGADTNAPSDWISFTNPTPGASNTAPSPTPTPFPSPTPEPSPSPTPTLSPTPSPSETSTPQPTPTQSPTPSPTPLPTPPSIPRVHINEFYPNTSGADADEEFIELWNEENASADISGWMIDDTDGGSPPHQTPANTIIVARGYLVFSRKITAIALNNDVDIVRLLTPGGQIYESVSYEKPPQGASSNRMLQGSFVWSWTPTPGRENVVSGAETASPKPSATPSATPAASPTASLPVDTEIPEASISPLIAKTGYLPASSNGQTDSQELSTADIFSSPSSVAPERFAANLVDAAPIAYQSFFSRYALVLALFGAAAGALGLVRWRRRRLTQKE